MGNRQTAHRQSVRIAFCSMMAALSTVLLLSGTLIPPLLYIAPLFCGVLLLPVMLEFGKKEAWLVWGVTVIMALLLGADREAAFFYLVIGWYPLVKFRLDKVKRPAVRLIIKLVLFLVTIGGMYLVMDLLMGLSVLEEFGGPVWMAAFVVMMAAVMLLYDRLLWPLCLVYSNRIRPKLHLFKQ